ncbi:hypothetical protein [Alkalimarinus alittae]|uniref:DUF1828 domain-containing protein n=1 Tax=Alkalimarinus alittae TaxID=2961619 RepID=A0ABY6N593_9ALTE|nr:hypothetical protein [Alkalimarinus alittae]UZE97261.1 hypothetical protein NKI27_05790 [Alkalimarinus alittae]
MSNDIAVFHFADDRSDKVWAIDSTINQSGEYTVWYGRNGSKLRHDSVSISPDRVARINEKLNSGYVRLKDRTIDAETCRMISIHQETETTDSLPTSLWYRIHDQVSLADMSDFLKSTVSNLAAYDKRQSEYLQATPVYKLLQFGNSNGCAEYKEGPLGVLLLFALRRYFQEKVEHLFHSGGLVQIADDNNNMLPDRFEDLGDYITDSCRQLFNELGFDDEMFILPTAKPVGMEHYSSIKTIKQLAIAMGCINAPIDLSVLQIETKAAFF